MGFQTVEMARKAAPATSGINASCSDADTQKARVVSISMNRDAQRDAFGREIDADADRFEIERGTGADIGQVRIVLSDKGAISARASMHGSIRFRLRAFPPIPQGAVKSSACKIVPIGAQGAGELVIRLPWHDGSRG